MSISPLAGKPAPHEMLTNIPRLVTAYFTVQPDPAEETQKVSFGTSGHRGISTEASFNENHILAITRALCEYRQSKGINGPLFIGADTHALSEPALTTALEVLAENSVTTFYQEGFRPVPTPVISHAILTFNRDNKDSLADGIVITPSHNPPDAGGFKYNPPHGGPADADVTRMIENRANDLLAKGTSGIKRIPLARALAGENLKKHDYIHNYVEDLKNVVNMEAVSREGLKLGVDPMGGASIDYWEPIADRYKLSLEIINPKIDFTFSFMTIDHDGKIRMDCSSSHAMASLIGMKDKFDVAFGNDPDSDRHGIVTSDGLMNPNHFLAASIGYLFENRPNWPKGAAVGKTLVSSAIIDRLTASMGRKLCEVPVGFKWFVDGLTNGTLGFGGEESAGASFLRKDGTVWTTDKDGIILDLLAAEITAVTGKTPSDCWKSIADRFETPFYRRTDVQATPGQKFILKKLSPEQVRVDTLAEEKIVACLTKAPCNDAPIGGLKVVTENGWFAARPSGTENIYKIYAESFKGEAHLKSIEQEAIFIVNDALGKSE